MNIGFAMTGSFCTFSAVFPIIEILTESYNIIPILSVSAATIDSRFGEGKKFVEKLEATTNNRCLTGIADVEPIGPKKLLEALIIAPCTGNTLAKLSHSIADTPVTMAAKSHLRNGRPIIVAISTNDALAGAAENIGRLLPRKNYYFVPFGQDDPIGKPTSIVANFNLIPQTLSAALSGSQLQPIII